MHNVFDWKPCVFFYHCKNSLKLVTFHNFSNVWTYKMHLLFWHPILMETSFGQKTNALLLSRLRAFMKIFINLTLIWSGGVICLHITPIYYLTHLWESYYATSCWLMTLLSPGSRDFRESHVCTQSLSFAWLSHSQIKHE